MGFAGIGKECWEAELKKQNVMLSEVEASLLRNAIQSIGLLTQ
jgi:hypothetical protein